MQKQASKKFFIFLSRFASCREFTFWLEGKTNLSHQRKVKIRMKIFIQNQYIIKKLKNFHFFGEISTSPGFLPYATKK